MKIDDSIVRGDDELAYWLRNARPGSALAVTICYDIMNERCPIPRCGIHVKIYDWDENKTLSIQYERLGFNDTGLKELLRHIQLHDPNRSISIDDLVLDEYGIPILASSDRERDIMNKTVAILQVLIKYQVNMSKGRNDAKYRKRAESLYRLAKEFLLTDYMICELTCEDHYDIRRKIGDGLDVYYGGKKNYPDWMKHVMGIGN